MKKWLITAGSLAVVGLIAFWFLTAPTQLSGQRFDALQSAAANGPDLANGEAVFWTGGCGSCHAPKGARGDDKKMLGGGHVLDTPAGVFVSPNISPDPETGIGKWTLNEFATAMFEGVSPGGRHYYPSFPYASYTRMSEKDVVDLWGYLQTLPAVSRTNEAHQLNPLFALRRGVGMWKLVFMNDAPVVAIADDDQIKRGQYLVEGAAHCGECHTPRTALGFGGMDGSRWLSGGPAPEGDGSIPNITPHESALGGWSAEDVAYYLESGFTPDFDSAGGSMTSVVDNMAQVPADDREAIAAYLKSIPPIAK